MEKEQTEPAHAGRFFVFRSASSTGVGKNETPTPFPKACDFCLLVPSTVTVPLRSHVGAVGAWFRIPELLFRTDSKEAEASAFARPRPLLLPFSPPRIGTPTSALFQTLSPLPLLIKRSQKSPRIGSEAKERLEYFVLAEQPAAARAGPLLRGLTCQPKKQLLPASISVKRLRLAQFYTWMIVVHSKYYCY